MTRIRRKASKLTKFEPNVGRTNNDAHLILDFKIVLSKAPEVLVLLNELAFVGTSEI